jgi:hypothetical protein
MATLPASESTLRASAPVFVPASERECVVCYTSDGDGVACQDGERECIVCFASGGDGVACQDGHFTCRNCLGPYVRDCCEKLAKINLIEGEAAEAERDNDVKRGHLRGHFLAGRISCPKAVDGCAAPPFTNKEVAMHADEETFEIYFEGRGKLPMARAVTAALQEQHETATLHNMMPNARMCGGCGYGPVDHEACADLTAHHGEPGRGIRDSATGTAVRSNRIDNSCPRCGWFAEHIDQWPMWNGVAAPPEDDSAEEFAERRRRREDELQREYEAREPQREMFGRLMPAVDEEAVRVLYAHLMLGEEEREREERRREEARRAAEEARRQAEEDRLRRRLRLLNQFFEQFEPAHEPAEMRREEWDWPPWARWAAEEDRRQARQARLRQQRQAQNDRLAEAMFGGPQQAPAGRREQRRLRRQRG